MNRRQFVATSSALAATSMLATTKATSGGIIDCNSYVGTWPFRQLPTASSSGCSERWVSSFEAIFHNDLAAANALTASVAKESAGKLRAVGEINLSLPDWPNDFDRCVHQHQMRVLRVHPNYHSWTLDSSAFAELLDLVSKEHILLQLVTQLEDERTQPRLMQVPPVDLKPLETSLKRVSTAKVMVLNANAAQVNSSLRGLPVTVDTGMLEGVGGLETLLTSWPVERVVFGSFTPLFYWESNLLKLKESELTPEQHERITTSNASDLLSS